MFWLTMGQIDAASAAEASWFNRYKPSAPKVTPEQRSLNEAKAPVKKFRTLADLSSE